MSAGTVEAVMIERIGKANDYLQAAMFCFGVVKKNRGRGKQEVRGMAREVDVDRGGSASDTDSSPVGLARVLVYLNTLGCRARWRRIRGPGVLFPLRPGWEDGKDGRRRMGSQEAESSGGWAGVGRSGSRSKTGLQLFV